MDILYIMTVYVKGIVICIWNMHIWLNVLRVDLHGFNNQSIMLIIIVVYG